jgi:hypothetical protein
MAKLQQTLHKVDPLDRVISSAVGLNMTPKTITTPQVLTQPTPDDVARAKRMSAAAQLQRTGRASTILSQPQTGDQLGA